MRWDNYLFQTLRLFFSYGAEQGAMKNEAP